MDIKITTKSEVDGMRVMKDFGRIEVSTADFTKVEDRLIKKAADLSNEINWVLDVKLYQRPNGKFLVSGVPVMLVEAEG